MSCERFSEAIAGHAAGADLDPAAAAHLGTCEACTARLETQRRLLADVDAELAGTLSLSASPEFVARVTSSVGATRSRSIAWRPATAWIGLAAAAAIIAAAILLRAPERSIPAAPAMAVVPAPPTQATTSARVSAAEPPTGVATPASAARPRRVSPPRRHPATTYAEPLVIVDANQARAIARLQQLLITGRLNEKVLPPPRPHEAAALTIPPLEIADIPVPDVETIGRVPDGGGELR